MNTSAKITMSLLASTLLLTSCKTYMMTREQLYTQIHAATPRDVAVRIPIATRTYRSNGVKDIMCTDKHGKPATIPNSPHIEMRITTTKNKKRIMFFDTVSLSDSTFTGQNSMILGTTRSVRYADIKKIEIQNGGKKYNYK